MTYRSRNDIISEILKAANGGDATRSKIMYQAFLNYNQMKDYLMVLTQNDLLSHDLNTRTFRTTEKGLRFLEAYNRMDSMMKAQQV
jgi:predicted transcriptional regulator